MRTSVYKVPVTLLSDSVPCSAACAPWIPCLHLFVPHVYLLGTEPGGRGQHSPHPQGAHSLTEEADHRKTSKYKYAVSGAAKVREESNTECLGREHRGRQEVWVASLCRDTGREGCRDLWEQCSRQKKQVQKPCGGNVLFLKGGRRGRNPVANGKGWQVHSFCTFHVFIYHSFIILHSFTGHFVSTHSAICPGYESDPSLPTLGVPGLEWGQTDQKTYWGQLGCLISPQGGFHGLGIPGWALL